MFKSKDGEPVQEEVWQWFVEYEDGSQLCQFDYHKEEYHYFAEIEQDKVKRFGLINHYTGKEAAFDPPKKSKLVHYYDNIVSQPMGGEAVAYRLYCFGYELKGKKHIFTILPNNFLIEGTVSGIL